jgi:hypothetical protein
LRRIAHAAASGLIRSNVLLAAVVGNGSFILVPLLLFPRFSVYGFPAASQRRRRAILQGAASAL